MIKNIRLKDIKYIGFQFIKDIRLQNIRLKDIKENFCF